MRADLAYDDPVSDWIADMLSILSNPDINGPLTKADAEEFCRQ
jgi:hypothetical protein